MENYFSALLSDIVKVLATITLIPQCHACQYVAFCGKRTLQM